MPDKSVSEKLADAKKAVANYDKKEFPKLPKANLHPEYGSAPYKMARPKKPIDAEIEGTGKSINYNLNQRKNANEALDSVMK